MGSILSDKIFNSFCIGTAALTSLNLALGVQVKFFQSRWITLFYSLFILSAVSMQLLHKIEVFWRWFPNSVFYTVVVFAHFPFIAFLYVIIRSYHISFIDPGPDFDEFATTCQVIWIKTGVLVVLLHKFTTLTERQTREMVSPSTHKLIPKVAKVLPVIFRFLLCFLMANSFETGLPLIDSEVKKVLLGWVVSKLTGAGAVGQVFVMYLNLSALQTLTRYCLPYARPSALDLLKECWEYGARRVCFENYNFNLVSFSFSKYLRRCENAFPCKASSSY